MKSSLVSAAALLAATAKAQSAPQFEVVVEQNLPVTYEASDTEVSPPGVLLPRDDVLEAPSVSLPDDASENQTYICFMIDQDVPRNGTTFTLLHWFRPDLHRSMDNSTLEVTMIDDNITTNQGAEYIPPTPPGGSGPHRYTFLLYEQPDNFTVPEEFADINPPPSTMERIGFNLTAFVAAADLGEPVAANYLRVLNGTEAETSSAETATGTVGVAPTESPTTVASTTDDEAAASATSEGGDDATTTTTAVATAEATDESASGSATADASSPASTEDSGASAMLNSGPELMLGLALAAVGASMFMA